MSNQIVISSGAKVRSLEGVLTGTAGIVNALGINVANGIPQLDSNAKILVSQLPNSVMEYKGTWNAATNTPTLANGTGNQGDVYLCNVAGTTNFGAGAITFAVGDQVIYSGTIWQKAGGSTGTVTSVALTETGDALTITGSPITTSGTINIGFAGTTGQYVNGAGGLTTFPSLTGFVPYTGATANLDLGTFDLTTDIATLNQVKAVGSGGLSFNSNSGTQVALMGGGGGAGTTFYGGIIGTSASFASSGGSDTFAINHSSGSGIALNITKGGNGEGLYINKTSGSGNAATIIGTLNATTLVKNGGTSSQYLMADGSVSTGPDLTGYVTLATTQTISGAKTFSNNVKIDNGSASAFLAFKQYSSGSTGTAGFTSIYAISTDTFGISFGAGNDILFKTASPTLPRTYTFPDASGTVALSSDLSSYVPYTGATADVALGNANSLSAYKVSLYNGSTYTALLGNTDGMSINFGIYVNRFYFSNANNTYTFPNASGVVALTSDIPSLSGYVQGSGTTNYHAKFTASGTIGNSMLTDDGTTLQSIGATRSNLYLKAASNSYYSQLAFTNGSNGSFGGISYNNSSQYMQFEANSSEWMRLNSDGKFLINGTSASNYFRLQVFHGSAEAGLLIKATNSGRYAPFEIRTDTNATQFTVLENGNVGIGTSSPSYKFTVEGAAGEVASIGTTTQKLIFYPDSAGTMISTAAGQGGEGIYFGDTSNIMSFQTANTERMRITSAGYLKVSNNGSYAYPTTTFNSIENSADDWTLALTSKSSAAPNGMLITYSASSPNGNGNWMIYAQDSSVLRFGVKSNGGINNYSGNNVNLSDITTKKDIIPCESYWDKFKAIEIVKFKYIDQTHDDYNIGVIAQQLEEVAPEFIDEDNWNKEDEEPKILKAVYTEDLHHATIKVLQEAMAKIEELEAKVSALENKS